MQQDTLQKSKQILKQQLPKWEAFHRLSQQPEYKEYLRPLLQQAQVNKWLNPEEFPNLKAFHKAYTESHGRAKAYAEIQNILEGAEKMIENIKKQMKDPAKSYESMS